MENKILKIFVLVFMLIVFMQSVSAIGITPGRNTIDFSPDTEKEYSFSIINTEYKDMRVAFSVSGEMAEYVKITNEVQEFKAGEDSKTFSYKIKQPKILSPGLHKADIIALELPYEGEEEGTIIRATVSVVTQVYVFVPYPGKYLDADLTIVNKEENDLILFYLPVISRGSEKIEETSAVISIYKNNEKISAISTNEISLNSMQKSELYASWTPNVLAGEYNAVAEVNYDGKIISIEKKFNVGNESLGVLGVSTNNFKLGDIAKIRVLVQNRMSDEARDVMSSMNVYNSDLSKVADLKSEKDNIPALSNKELVMYWDTQNIEKGDYSSELRLDYSKKFVSKNFKIRITGDSMTFTGVGFAIKSEGGKKISMNTILIIVIGILVLVNAIWFISWMRGKAKVKGKDSGKIWKKKKDKAESGGVIIYKKK